MTESVLTRHRAPFERAPRVLLSLLTLGGIGFSFALMVAQLWVGDKRTDFLVKNSLEPRQRLPLLGLALGAAALPLLGFAIAWLFAGQRGQARAVEGFASRWSAILGPLLLLFWLPVLFEPRLAQANPLMYVVILGALVFPLRLLLERAFDALGEVERPRWLAAESRLGRAGSFVVRKASPLPIALTIVAVSAAAYCAYGAYHAVQSHRLIQTTAWDLGMYDNLMSNALSGRWFQAPLLFGRPQSYLSVHAEYGMLLFLPIYALRPHAETLLLLQAAVLGFAALPLYLTAARFLSRTASAIVALAYLMCAAVHASTFSGFHWLPFAIFFEFWLFYAIAAEKNWIAAAMAVAACSFREDVALGVAFLGLFLVVAGKRVRLGWILAAAAATWFCFSSFVLIPRIAAAYPGFSSPSPFAAGRTTLGGALVSTFSNPLNVSLELLRENRVQYALHFLAPLAFLPLRRPALLLLLIPGALASLSATSFWPSTPSASQLTAHWVPFVFLAAVLALSLMRFEPRGASRRAAALCALCVVMLGHSRVYGAVLDSRNFHREVVKVLDDMTPEAKARYARLMRLAARIPRDASVAATDYVAPHVSARREARSFRHELGPVDYVIVSSLEVHGDNLNKLASAAEQHKLGLVAKEGEFYLFKRAHTSAGTDAALRELGASRPPNHG
jgi:uncharacterized membrane protein